MLKTLVGHAEKLGILPALLKIKDGRGMDVLACAQNGYIRTILRSESPDPTRARSTPSINQKMHHARADAVALTNSHFRHTPGRSYTRETKKSASIVRGDANIKLEMVRWTS